MKFFNANAMIGPHFTPRAGKFHSAEDLLSEMDFFGIEKALVWHGMSKDYNLFVGNEMLVKELTGSNRLIPAFIAGVEDKDPDHLLEQFAENRIKAARMVFGDFLNELPYPDVIVYEAVFTFLQKHKVPVFLQFDSAEGSDINAIYRSVSEVCEAFPDLPVVVLHGLKAAGEGYRLQLSRLKKYANLYVESNNFHLGEKFETICREVGAERILYSSYFPYFASGLGKIALSYADISEEEKEKIAAGNLDRLLGEVSYE
ncbi:MAG: amidohydrolase family protein [Planctomycetota bacterium]|jgi:predicted TIM-barrel fold metal-dependent hydrolase